MNRTDSTKLTGEPQGYFLVVPGSEAASEIDLRAIVRDLWHGRWWLVAAISVTLAIAAAHAFLATPIYRAEVVLAVRLQEPGGALGSLRSQLGGLAALAGIGLGEASGKRAEYVAFLKSRELARDFIETRQLMPVLYESRWDPVAKRFRPGLRGNVPTMGDAIEYFDEIRTFRDEVRTGLVTVSFEWSDRKLAAAWANDYVALANERLRQEAIDNSRQSITYLNQELRRTQLEPVRQSLFSLMEGRLNQAMMASVEREYAFKTIDAAAPAEAHKFVRPRRFIELLIGIVGGFVLGGALVLWRRSTGRPQG